MASARLDRLTSREREVLAHMARGETNAQIAEALDISFATAKTHVSDILTRLDCTSREEAVALWKREGSVSRPVKRISWALGLAAICGVAATAAAVSVFASDNQTEEQRMLVPASELEQGQPRAFETDALGINSFGQQIPVWIVQVGDQYHAFAGRDPHSNCLLGWQPDYQWQGAAREPLPGETPDSVAWLPDDSGGLSQRSVVRVPAFTGAFKAFCSGWVFTQAGEIVFGASPRELDRLIAYREGDNVVVLLDRVWLGACRGDSPPACSTPGEPSFAPALPPPLIADWAAGR